MTANYGPGLNAGAPITLTQWLGRVRLGRNSLTPVCYLGQPDCPRQFNDWLASVGLLRYQGGAPQIKMSARKMAKEFVRRMSRPGVAARHVLELRVPRDGFHVINRYISILCIAAGPEAYIDYVLEDAARVLMTLEKDGIERIVGARGERRTQVPVDNHGRLDIREGALVITCSKNLTWLQAQLRSPLRHRDGTIGEIPTGSRGSDHGEIEHMQDPFAINPGSGLPTVAGLGSPDIAGHQWGHGPGTDM